MRYCVIIVLITYSIASLSAQIIFESYALTRGASIENNVNSKTSTVIVGEPVQSNLLSSGTFTGSKIGFIQPISQIVNNTKPIANAGVDLDVQGFSQITLDGSGSTDANGDSLRFLWFTLDNQVLDDSSAIQPSFTPSNIKAIRNLKFILVVNDGFESSDPDTVNIKVTNPQWTPVVYPNSASFVGVVHINFEEAASDDVVGAFINNECRGTSGITVFQDSAYAIMNIQSEQSDSVVFQIYDHSEDQLCEVTKKAFVIPGQDLGNPASPYLVHGICCIDILALQSNLGPLSGKYEAHQQISIAELNDIDIILGDYVELNAPEIDIPLNRMLSVNGELYITNTGCIKD